MIEFDGTFELDRPPEELWPYFTDPDVLAACSPGVDEMNLVEPWQVESVVAVKVGSVKPSFNVEATVTEATRPSDLTLVADGSASRNSFEGSATMHLEPTDDGGTIASWTAGAEVSGRIASFGGRALRSVTGRLVNKFFSELEATIEAGEGATSQLEAAPDPEPDVAVGADELEEGDT